jgi:thermostable 8-oxoguanine DNA glycosylase
MIALTIEQFADELPDYYQRYTQSQYYETYINLETRLSQKAKNIGYLELVDLVDIAEWGGNQHAIKKRLQAHNSPEEVKFSIKKAIQQVENPAIALRELLVGINHWGLSYASKTLRFINPQSYAALDQKLRNNIDRSLLPRIYDGHIDSMVKGYLSFLDICQEIRSHATAPAPRSNRWFIADIEMGLFQFVWDACKLVN